MKNGFTETESKFITKQIIATLFYLHSQGLAHRDIKLENIIVDAEMNIKIIDFGFVSINNID
jgi:serine/threonine protein kinase